MDNTQQVVSELITVMLAALSDRGYFVSPQCAPVGASYRKHVFWLPKRNDEENKVIVLSATATMVGDCDLSSGLSIAAVPEQLTGILRADPAGFYQIDRPHNQYAIRGLSCDNYPPKTYVLRLTDNNLPYSSNNPIVIHAHEDIDIAYTVEDKVAVTGS
ncbi:Carboxypeptidase regulatory-like domain-containing protein [Pseudomonas sp. IT-347P]|uniref:ecotin family protein n=1 Tax=Pseudomonas sp. IT-347P TaxID=3026458 RepID=UPI0039E1ED0F